MIDETVVGSKASKISKPAKAAKEKVVATKKAKKVVKAKKAAKSGGSPKVGSGAFIRELLAKDWSTEDILEAVHKKFPGSKAKASDVSWNRGFADRAKAAKKSKK